MAQHAFWREDDERFAPRAASLAPQHVEILRGIRGLANLNVVFAGELQKAFDAGAGMFRPLAFKSVRKKKDDARRKIPFVFTCADELIDNHLRAVYEVAELRFPQNEGFGIVAAETVLKAKAAGFRKRRIINFAEGLSRREVRQRDVRVFGLRIHENRVTLVESATLRVLSGKAQRRSFAQQGTESQRFRESIINSAFAVAHFRALFE